VLRAGEVPLTADSFAYFTQAWQQLLAHSRAIQKEIGDWTRARPHAVKARANSTKDEAVQVLRQLKYTATEARKAVDAAWEKYGPMDTAAEIVKRVFEKTTAQT
jgi:Holliday junction resolvasome RuvABC DNA-binding subunit